jgi:hypothetical protein
MVPFDTNKRSIPYSRRDHRIRRSYAVIYTIIWFGSAIFIWYYWTTWPWYVYIVYAILIFGTPSLSSSSASYVNFLERNDQYYDPDGIVVPQEKQDNFVTVEGSRVQVGKLSTSLITALHNDPGYPKAIYFLSFMFCIIIWILIFVYVKTHTDLMFFVMLGSLFSTPLLAVFLARLLNKSK